jgi:hypothetical protein
MRTKNFQNQVIEIPSNVIEFYRTGMVKRTDIRTYNIEWNKKELKKLNLPSRGKIELKFTTAQGKGNTIIYITNQVGIISNPNDLSVDLSDLGSRAPRVTIHVYTASKSNYIAISNPIVRAKATGRGKGLFDAKQDEMSDNIIWYLDIGVSTQPVIYINKKLTDNDVENAYFFFPILSSAMIQSYEFLIRNKILGDEDSNWMQEFEEILLQSGFDKNDYPNDDDDVGEAARDMTDSVLSQNGDSLIETVIESIRN